MEGTVFVRASLTGSHHLSCHLLPLLPLSRILLLLSGALLSRPRAAAARATAGALLLERCCVSAAAAVVLLLECCCWSAAARGHQRTFREDGWPAGHQPSSRKVLFSANFICAHSLFCPAGSYRSAS